MSIRFTVGVPTYNRANYLPYTLSCLLQQTYRDFEVVISDNASTDNTADVVRQYNDPRIRYVRQPALVGPAQRGHLRGRLLIDPAGAADSDQLV